MQYKKLSLLFYILLFTSVSHSQISYTNINFRSPVDIPIYLAGNFGEIRSSHFHAGIDIKTQGVIGKKIYAVENGYISRIKVSVNSYGKTIYINHSNGYTTVYGHLNKFNSKLDKLIKEIQYHKNEFEINYIPKQNELLVTKGEIIGYSGNSGSSEGPHLHFEVRETAYQIPVNPLFFNFNITDNIAPVLYNLIIYPLGKRSKINGKNNILHLKLKQIENKFSICDTSQIAVTGKIGFGIEMNDFLNNSRNKCGIYNLTVSVDSLLIYSHSVDKFAFNENGYVKSHIDYAEKVKSKKTIQKTFIAPNNDLSIYKFNLNKGAYTFDKDYLHNIKIVAADVSGNISELSFNVLGQAPNYTKQINIDSSDGTFMNWEAENIFEENEIMLNFPKRTFFDTLHFEYATSKSPIKAFSSLHHVHNIYTALNKRYSISIKTHNLPLVLSKKAFIAELYEDEVISIGGTVVNGHIVSEATTFGNFVVLIDTISPEIKLKSDLKNLNKNIIEFLISDDLTGIKSYNGYIDNNWALFEYDQKNDLLFYIIDEDRIDKNIEHDLELFVTDKNDNITTYYTNFHW
ncbi:MAG: peptidoglycan DD-metalloendopeptidase family protein [Bacteroidales bacterium]|nr:peptidoglycan DD-metalloendopeptidase family protein [Bacteroidales bacterium]